MEENLRQSLRGGDGQIQVTYIKYTYVFGFRRTTDKLCKSCLSCFMCHLAVDVLTCTVGDGQLKFTLVSDFFL